MADKSTGIQIRGFKGLNIREDPGAIDDTELTEAININIGKAGEIQKRTGLEKMHNGTTLGSNSTKILGHFLTDTISQLIVKAGGNVYYSTDAANYTLIGAYSDAEWGVQYAGAFYIIRSGNVIVKWDGTTATNVAGSPSGTFGIIYKERMFVLNTAATGTLSSRLYFSNAGDVSATGWIGTNFFDIQPGDGDFLVTLVILNDLLYIFKGKATWALYVQGTVTDWIVRTINSEFGCVSKYAAKIIAGYLYLSSEKGIYRTDGTSFTDISLDIGPVLVNRVVNLTTVNIDSMGIWGDQLICLISPSSGQKLYYIYHYRIGTWTQWQFSGGLLPQTFFEVRANTPGVGLYAGDNNSTGIIFRYGTSVYTDAGASYQVSIRSKEFDVGIPLNMKRGKWIGVDLIGDSNISYEQLSDYVNLVTGTFVSTSTRSLAKLPGPGYFRVWKFSLIFSNTGSMTILGFTLQLEAHRAAIKANT